MARATLTELKVLRAAFKTAATDVSEACARLCARAAEAAAPEAELTPVRAKASEFAAGLDVDAASALGILQDAVQFMLPIIKALTLAELQVADAKGRPPREAAPQPAAAAPDVAAAPDAAAAPVVAAAPAAAAAPVVAAAPAAAAPQQSSEA